MRGRLIALSACLGALLLSGSCGSPSGPACAVVAASCPTPVPSFAAVVFPIIQRSCTPCHSPTGVEPVRPYLSYDDVKKVQISILLQVRDCRMPLSGAAPLGDDERTALLGWLYCDAPNN